MDKNEIIIYIQNSMEIETYCKSIRPLDWEELKSELILQLFDMKENKIILAYRGNFLEYLCFKIIKRISYGTIKSTGIFYKNNIVLTDDIFPEIIDNNEDLERISRIWEIVEREHWYQKILFTDYYKKGMTLKQISDKYGINIKSVFYAISRLKNKIKNIINEEENR